MRRLLFEIAYRGTAYHGYQVQQNARTVAEVMQDAIEVVFKNGRGLQAAPEPIPASMPTSFISIWTHKRGSPARLR